jgi:hypothetical protein
MKLKDILNESIGGLVEIGAINKLEPTQRMSGIELSKIAKQLVRKEEDEKLMAREDLVKHVSEFASYGNSIYKKHNLSEVGTTFMEIAKSAQKHVVKETEDWFDKVTVQRNMAELKKQATQFHKISNEAQGLQDRMSALYEDMGNILNRYFNINELNEDGYENTKKEPVGMEDEDEKY